MTAHAPERQHTAPAPSLRSLLHVLFKHKGKILTIFSVTAIIVATTSFLIPPTFEATASLMVKIGREYIPKPEVGSATSNLMVVNQEEIINSEIAILDNRDIIEKVITSIGLSTIYPQVAAAAPDAVSPMDLAVTRFAKALTAEGVKKSNVISVSFQHRNPVVATTALTLLIDFFKEKHLEIFSNPQSSFLQQQLSEYQQRLKESETALEHFKEQHQIYSLTEQRSLLLKQQIQFDTALKKTEHRIEELQKKAASYRQQLRDLAQSKTRYTQSERDRVLVNAQTRLLSLQLREQELLAKDYRQDSTLVTSTRNDIRLVQEFLKDQEAAIARKVGTANPVYQQIEAETLKVEAELASQRAGAATLAQQVRQIHDNLQDLDQMEKALRNLQRTLTTNEKNYMTYDEKFEEARISDDLNRQKIANISVIQAPATPTKPVKPKKLLNIILGALLGAVSGLCYAFFVEFTSQNVSTPEQAQQRLGLPVLTSIALK